MKHRTTVNSLSWGFPRMKHGSSTRNLNTLNGSDGLRRGNGKPACVLGSVVVCGVLTGTGRRLRARAPVQSVMRLESCDMASPPIVSLRLPEHLAKFVQREAERQFRSRNSWVAELIAREYAAKNGGAQS